MYRDARGCPPDGPLDGPPVGANPSSQTLQNRFNSIHTANLDETYIQHMWGPANIPRLHSKYRADVATGHLSPNEITSCPVANNRQGEAFQSEFEQSTGCQGRCKRNCLQEGSSRGLRLDPKKLRLQHIML